MGVSQRTLRQMEVLSGQATDDDVVFAALHEPLTPVQRAGLEIRQLLHNAALLLQTQPAEPAVVPASERATED